MKPRKTIVIILLVLAYALGGAVLLTSCEIQRDCPGAGRKNGYVGYANGHVKPVKGAKRQSY
jgi:hypothetical protein